MLNNDFKYINNRFFTDVTNCLIIFLKVIFLLMRNFGARGKGYDCHKTYIFPPFVGFANTRIFFSFLKETESLTPRSGGAYVCRRIARQNSEHISDGRQSNMHEPNPFHLLRLTCKPHSNLCSLLSFSRWNSCISKKHASC